MAYWLMKTEPDVFGYDDLVRVKREGWDGIRNYQARNFLRAMRKGDQAIFYHSNATPPGVAGVAKIVKRGRARPHAVRPDEQVLRRRLQPRRPAVGLGDGGTGEEAAASSRSTTCARCPSSPSAACSAKGNRLSVIPLTDDEFDAIVARGSRRP